MKNLEGEEKRREGGRNRETGTKPVCNTYSREAMTRKANSCNKKKNNNKKEAGYS